MTVERTPLQRVDTTHGFRGFGGLLVVELRVWFPWRFVTLVLAGLAVFGSIYVPWALVEAKQLGPLMLFGMGLWAFVMLISTISISEGTVLGDISRGTASWLVALPVGRPAVVAAKFTASAIGLFAAIFTAGMVMYPVLISASRLGITDFSVGRLLEVTGAPIGQWGAWISMPALGSYLALLAGMSVLAIFLTAVMILLGTVLRSRTMVFGLGLVLFAVVVVGWLLAREPLAASPVGVVTALADGLQARPIDLLVPAVASLLISLGVIALAIWRFERRELS